MTRSAAIGYVSDHFGPVGVAAQSLLIAPRQAPDS
jgi:hypothetical protein